MEGNDSTDEKYIIWKSKKTGKEVKLHFQNECNHRVKGAIIEILLDAYTNHIQGYSEKDKNNKLPK